MIHKLCVKMQTKNHHSNLVNYLTKIRVKFGVRCASLCNYMENGISIEIKMSSDYSLDMFEPLPLSLSDQIKVKGKVSKVVEFQTYICELNLTDCLSRENIEKNLNKKNDQLKGKIMPEIYEFKKKMPMVSA